MSSRFNFIGVALALTAAAALPTDAHAACSNDNRCSGGPARVMLILDASSDTLNDGMVAGGREQTEWDLFRSLFEREQLLYGLSVAMQGPVASHVIHFGLTVYGDDTPAPGEHKLVVDYGPCTRPNISWALDPATSCDVPGCTDPWGGPVIDWTFKDGSAIDPPDFAMPTVSHMPRCQGTGGACEGSGRFVHLGIAHARDRRAQYLASTPFVHDDTTLFVNVLLVAGPYSGFSSDAQVQDALEAEFNDGVVTYVIGFGEAAEQPTTEFSTELDNLAAWGSGGTEGPLLATNPGELEIAMRTIVGDLDLPCCRRIDCSAVGGAPADDSDQADTWGSADGGGSASNSGTGGSDSMGSGAAGTDAAQDGLDDDGGCRCSTSPKAPAWSWLAGFGLGALRRRRRA